MTRIISYSELFKWDTCPRQFYYRFGLGLAPAQMSDAINTGVKGHRLLQSFYELKRDGLSDEDALKRTRDSANGLIKNESISEIGPLLKSWTLVDNYIRENKFNSEAILVENRFLIPFDKIDEMGTGLDLQIGFTPDVVFEGKGGILEVEDAKFVGKAWSKKKLDRFNQAKLYQIFLNRMGYNVQRSSVRFFNTTTAKMSVQHYTLSALEERILLRDFSQAVMEVVTFHNQPDEFKQFTRRTMNYTTCQFCDFAVPCGLEAAGKSAANTLKYEYVKSDYSYVN